MSTHTRTLMLTNHAISDYHDDEHYYYYYYYYYCCCYYHYHRFGTLLVALAFTHYPTN